MIRQHTALNKKTVVTIQSPEAAAAWMAVAVFAAVKSDHVSRDTDNAPF